MLNRKCPNCCNESVSVPELIISDVECASCGQLVGVQWAFRAAFFFIIFVATVFTGLIILIEQGLYAAILMITLPIGAIGVIKAQYCPLVIRPKRPDVQRWSGGLD